MKVLCQQSTGFVQEEMTAWGRSLISNNHDFLFFDINKKPIFDALYEKKPDIVIVNSDEADRKIVVLAEKYPKCKFVLLDINAYSEIKYDLKNIIRFSYLNNDISPCYDPFVYKIGSSNQKYASEVNCILSEFNKEYLYLSDYFDIKIFGKGKWPITNYVGDISEKEKKDIVASCQYSVCGSTIQDLKWFIECMACHKHCFAYKNEFVKKIFSSDFCFDNPREMIINLENDNQIKHDILENYSSHKQISRILNKVL